MLQTLYRHHGPVFGVFALLVLGVGLLAAGPSLSTQVVLLVPLVALLGLPHGALDPLLAHSAGLLASRARAIRFFGFYLLQAFAALALWWAVPSVALAVLLLMSVWHFGGDWRDTLGRWQALSGGACVVLLPVVSHPAETGWLFGILVSDLERGATLAMSLRVPALLASAALMLTIVRLVLLRSPVAFELLSLSLLAVFLPPLLFFALYFCGLHSFRHLLRSLAATVVRPKTVVVVGAAFTLGALTFAGAAFLLTDSASLTNSMLRVVFIGLFVLSVPHMILTERVSRRLGLHSRLADNPTAQESEDWNTPRRPMTSTS